MHIVHKVGFLLLLYAPVSAWACWNQAAHRYGVPVQLLVAIARVESNLNPRAMNLSHRQWTGSYDIGLMQINSSNLPTLAKFGIHEKDLLDPCTNIHIGAWLLALNLERYGANWDGVGAYNAACVRLKGTACRSARARYAWQVYRRLASQQGVASSISTVANKRMSAVRHYPRPAAFSVAQVTP